MTSRQRRALQKWFTRKIIPMGPGVWIVNQRKRNGKQPLPYTVREEDDGKLSCTCEGFEENLDCTHCGAVTKYILDGPPKDGYGVREAQRPTYPGDNVRGRAARRVMHLAIPLVLRALARTVFPITGKRGRGRPPTEMADLIFGIGLRGLNKCGGATAQALIRDAFDRRLLYHRPIEDARPPSEDAITAGMRKPATLKAFETLIERSNDPFRGKSDMIAIDGSAFNTPRRSKTEPAKPNSDAVERALAKFEDEERERLVRAFSAGTAKLHAAVSVSDRMFTAAIVSKGTAGDATYAIELIERSRRVRSVTTLIADKAYFSSDILAYLHGLGIEASIPAKLNSSEESERPFIAEHTTAWRNRTEQQKDVYGRRQLIESAFSRLKGHFGYDLRSVTLEAQQVEVLCMVLLANVRTLIEEYVAGKIDIAWLDGHCKKLLDPARNAVHDHPHADRTPRYHDNLDPVIARMPIQPMT